MSEPIKTFEDRWEQLQRQFPDKVTREMRQIMFGFYEYGRVDGGREELANMRMVTDRVLEKFK